MLQLLNVFLVIKICKIATSGEMVVRDSYEYYIVCFFRLDIGGNSESANVLFDE